MGSPVTHDSETMALYVRSQKRRAFGEGPACFWERAGSHGESQRWVGVCAGVAGGREHIAAAWDGQRSWSVEELIPSAARCEWAGVGG